MTLREEKTKLLIKSTRLGKKLLEEKLGAGEAAATKQEYDETIERISEINQELANGHI